MSPLKVYQGDDADLPGERTVRILSPGDPGYEDSTFWVMTADGPKKIKLVDTDSPWALKIWCVPESGVIKAWGDDEEPSEYDLFLTLDFTQRTYISNIFTWVQITDKTVPVLPKVRSKTEYAEVDSFTPPFGGSYQLIMQSDPSLGGSADYLGDNFAEEGEWVEVIATPAENYVFTGWTSEGWSGGDGSFIDSTSAITAFIMPGNTVTVTASFEYVEPSEEEEEEAPEEPELVVADEDTSLMTATNWNSELKTFSESEEDYTGQVATRETRIGKYCCPIHTDYCIDAGDYDGQTCDEVVGEELCGSELEWVWIDHQDRTRSWSIRRDTGNEVCITNKYTAQAGSLVTPHWAITEVPSGTIFSYSSTPYTFWGCYFGYKGHHDMVYYTQAEYDELEETVCPTCGHELYRLSISIIAELLYVEGETEKEFTNGRTSSESIFGTPVKYECESF